MGAGSSTTPAQETCSFWVNAWMKEAIGAATGQKAKEIKVAVNRDSNGPVGVRVQIEVGSLTVLEIQSGLIKSWNEQNPSQAVRSGDKITSVNGHKGQSEMLTELHVNRPKLDIVFVREAAPSEVPVFQACLTRTSPSSELGMEVDQDHNGLVVSRVQQTGLVRDWNRGQAPGSSTIQAGVRVLSVNGSKEPQFMLRELASATSLRIVAAARTPSTADLVKVVQLPFTKGSNCSRGKDDSPVCSICLEDVEADACVVRLPCTHSFHVECATRWLTRCHCVCPVCRSPV